MTDSIETSESEAQPWAPASAPAATPPAAGRPAHLDAAPSSFQEAMASMFERNSVAMVAAVIEARQNGAAEGMQWIVNTLAGPGLLPDPGCTDAQAYFDLHAPSITACCYTGPREPAAQLDALMKLADEYAHRYSFVEDDSMPRARAALQSALQAFLPAGVEQLQAELARLNAIINEPHTDEFLQAVSIEAEHQRQRWGHAHDRSKSAENWFWLVGYLAGKALRAVITGDRHKGLHHTVSSAAALKNWNEAIQADQTGSGIGDDADLKKHAAPLQPSPLEESAA